MSGPTIANAIPNALSIAGSDPSGGAGIQADLKSFSANRVFGMAAITALTAQNTHGVSDIHLPPASFIASQIDAIFEDVQVDAIKIGMVATAEIAATVRKAIRDRPCRHIVLDPVMVAKGGASLLDSNAVASVRRDLLPLAGVLTPNLPEAGVLLGQAPATSRAEMSSQAHALLEHGPQAVLMKGGHFDGTQSPDLLVNVEGEQWFEAERIDSANTHGTGCSLSSALAANLARGMSLAIATAEAKRFITNAIRFAVQLDVGSGHGPTHHFHTLWKDE